MTLQTINVGTVANDGTGTALRSAMQIINSNFSSTPIILANGVVADGKTIANTALYVVPAGKTLIVTAVVVRCTAASAITVGPSAGIGNVAGTSNIAASAAITSLQTTTDTFTFSISGASKATAATGTVYLNLGTGATGTSQTLAVDLIGYLV